MTNLLNLGCYRVLSTKETEHDYHVKVETTQPPTTCEECGSDNIVGGGRHEVVARDTTMHGKRVSIYIQARRISCRNCGKTLTEKLPEIYPGYRVTTRLYAYISKQSLQRTNTSVTAVNGVAPDGTGNVTLTAANVGATTDSLAIAYAIALG